MAKKRNLDPNELYPDYIEMIRNQLLSPDADFSSSEEYRTIDEFLTRLGSSSHFLDFADTFHKEMNDRELEGRIQNAFDAVRNNLFLEGILGKTYLDGCADGTDRGNAVEAVWSYLSEHWEADNLADRALTENLVTAGEIETLSTGLDAFRSGYDAFTFIRPTAEQIEAGLKDSRNFSYITDGYFRAHNDVFPSRVDVIEMYDAMNVFDNDFEAARQAEKDGMKLIWPEQLDYPDDAPEKGYVFVDDEYSRTFLGKHLIHDYSRFDDPFDYIFTCSPEQAASRLGISEEDVFKWAAEQINSEHNYNVQFTPEYIEYMTRQKKASWDEIRKLESPALPFLDDKEKMHDFDILSKEAFLKSYSYIDEASYDFTGFLHEKSQNIHTIVTGMNFPCGFVLNGSPEHIEEEKNALISRLKSDFGFDDANCEIMLFKPENGQRDATLNVNFFVPLPSHNIWPEQNASSWIDAQVRKLESEYGAYVSLDDGLRVTEVYDSKEAFNQRIMDLRLFDSITPEEHVFLDRLFKDEKPSGIDNNSLLTYAAIKEKFHSLLGYGPGIHASSGNDDVLRIDVMLSSLDPYYRSSNLGNRLSHGELVTSVLSALNMSTPVGENILHSDPVRNLETCIRNSLSNGIKTGYENGIRLPEAGDTYPFVELSLVPPHDQIRELWSITSLFPGFDPGRDDIDIKIKCRLPEDAGGLDIDEVQVDDIQVWQVTRGDMDAEGCIEVLYPARNTLLVPEKIISAVKDTVQETLSHLTRDFTFNELFFLAPHPEDVFSANQPYKLAEYWNSHFVKDDSFPALTDEEATLILRALEFEEYSLYVSGDEIHVYDSSDDMLDDHFTGKKLDAAELVDTAVRYMEKYEEVFSNEEIAVLKHLLPETPVRGDLHENINKSSKQSSEKDAISLLMDMPEKEPVTDAFIRVLRNGIEDGLEPVPAGKDAIRYCSSRYGEAGIKALNDFFEKNKGKNKEWNDISYTEFFRKLSSVEKQPEKNPVPEKKRTRNENGRSL